MLTDIDTASGAKILIFGLSNSGKSVLIARLIYDNYDKFDYIRIYCPTSADQEVYDFFDRNHLITEFSFEDVKRDIEFIKTYATSPKTSDNKDIPKKKSFRSLIVFDDAASNDINLYDPKQKKWFTGLLGEARHYNMSFIFSLQSVHATIPPGIRDQLQVVYYFNANIPSRELLKLVPLSRNKEGKKYTPELLDQLRLDFKYTYDFIRFNRMASKERPAIEYGHVKPAPEWHLKYIIINK